MMNKWAALTGLYVVQGLPHGFFGQAMPVLLREQGLDLTLIGMLSLVALPWAFKFVWAPALDRVTLRAGEFRRSWIFTMNACALAMILLLSSQPLESWLENGVWLPLLLLIVLNTFIATQDIATDAMAVENLSVRERGKGNGLQVGAYRVGMVLAGGLLISQYGSLGWQGALWLVAGMMLLGTLPLWFFKPAQHTPPTQPLMSQWLGFFRLKEAGLWLLLILFFKFGDAFGTPMIRPMLSDAGLSLEQLGTLLGTVGFASGLLGALAGGWMVSVLGRQITLLGFLLLEALALMSYVGISHTADPSLLRVGVAIVLEHVAGGMATAALFTVMMDRCREHSEAADYALQSCLVIIAGMVAAALSGFSAKMLGYDAHFIVSGFLTLAAIPIVWALIRRGVLKVKR